MKKQKMRAVRYFGMFLLFMLVCTIVSRGIYASQMPRIQTGTAERKGLTRKIEAQGFVLTKEELPVVTEAGLLVEKVAVVEGQKVEEGELLFQISSEDLEEAVQKADLALAAAEAALADLVAGGNTAVNRASQDLKDASDAASGEVNRANEAYQAAKSERDAFPSEEQYKKDAYKKDAEYQKLSKAAQKKDAAKKEKEAFSEYKKSLDAGLSERYASEKKALEDAVLEREQALGAANAEKNNALKSANRALEDAKRQTSGEGSRYEQQNQVRFLKEGKERLLALKQAEGKVLSSICGYVSRIFVHAGERTTDASAIVISDASGEKLFQAVLPKEEKGYLVPSDTMNLTFPGGAADMYGVKIDAVGELEDGSCQITAGIAQTKAEIGATAAMEIQKEIGRYSCCIPLSALHSVDGTDFVYLVQEQPTILGMELTVRKCKVRVLEKDESYAALEEGTLTEEDIFVAEADKEIRDRARVRLEE